MLVMMMFPCEQQQQRGVCTGIRESALIRPRYCMSCRLITQRSSGAAGPHPDDSSTSGASHSCALLRNRHSTKSSSGWGRAIMKLLEPRSSWLCAGGGGGGGGGVTPCWNEPDLPPRTTEGARSPLPGKAARRRPPRLQGDLWAPGQIIGDSNDIIELLSNSLQYAVEVSRNAMT